MTREEAINELKIFNGTTRIRLSANFWEALNMAIKALEQQPKWIPVSERLPEDKQRCFVTLKNLIATRNICETATYSTDLYKVDRYDFADRKNVPGFYGFDGEYGYFEWTEVIAWMPLPEPYKAESEG